MLLKIAINSNKYSEVIQMSNFKRLRDYVLYTSTENTFKEPFWYYNRGLDDIFLPDGVTSVEDIVVVLPKPPTDEGLTAIIDQAIVNQAIAI